MKILWFTPIFPYPPFSGGQTRAYNLIKNLAKSNQICLFSFIRPGKVQGPISELKKYCFKIKTFAGRRTWTPRNVLLAGFSNLPFAITHFYQDKKVIRALSQELKTEKYDLVHFESFYTSPYVKYVSSVPTVMGNENIEYLVYERFVNLKRFSPLKLMLTYDIWKMKIFEQNIWRKADLNLAISPSDTKIIEKVTGKKCEVIPNGVDIGKFKNISSPATLKKDYKLLFVGDFRYFTNQDAINYLIKMVWPMIKEKVPKSKLWLVGKNPTFFVKRINSKDIIVDTSVDDICQAYGQADLLLAPMRIKGGSNIKILEAMAAGLPVVTTSVGIEGIEANDGREVVIADKPQDLANQIVKLLNNPQKRRELGLAGRKLVTEKYDWSKIGEKLNKVYEKIA